MLSLHVRLGTLAVDTTHEREKNKKYLEPCFEQRRRFTPFVVSTDGRLLQARKRSTRNSWMASTYSNIHWPANYRSFKKRKLTSQLRIQFFSDGWLPVGRIRHRINKLLRQKRNLQPRHEMPRYQNSASSGRSYCSGYHRLVP
jgi:hypothetical protein